MRSGPTVAVGAETGGQSRRKTQNL